MVCEHELRHIATGGVFQACELEVGVVSHGLTLEAKVAIFWVFVLADY